MRKSTVLINSNRGKTCQESVYLELEFEFVDLELEFVDLEFRWVRCTPRTVHQRHRITLTATITCNHLALLEVPCARRFEGR